VKLLRVEDIRKSFGSLQVLDGVSCELEKGETKVIIGPSGTGKSTLLRCINLLTKPDSGRVWLDGVEVTDPKTNINHLRSSIGMVFQNFNLVTHLKVLDNVRIGPMRVKRIDKKRATDLALEKLTRVGLSDKVGSYPAELSGGQQQRVSIARALAMEPKLILFDEPTSALDPELIGEVLAVMEDLAQSGMSLVVVTHEIGFAHSVADEVIFLENGKILEQSPPEKMFTEPKRQRTQEFLQKITHLYGHESRVEEA
jgi:polar amino acid transport system ATP-binding protein